MDYITTLLLIILTFAAYLFSRFLFMRYQNPLLNVVIISSAFIVAVLFTLHLPYAAYRPGKEIMTILLGPATVALAVPLYNNRAVLQKNLVTVVVGVCLASLLTSLTAMGITRLLGMPKDIVVAIGSKSVTAPIAAQVAAVNGGDPEMAIAFVVVTGALGAIAGPTLLTLLKITNPIIRGLAMGTTAHGQGTATALMEGEQQGMMAGIGMTLSAIITSALLPILISILWHS
ncbi:LrgB family protein [Sporomusa termitida]|uniref:Holin-like protein CidB n=1 Tax=Sporomusa termitida TaxID=2377 RepID=A0A517DNV8_9FIRM|nr:LrgB family protein [Sporomusa termitida]QDR78998.1 Holin-like protein CidB [Sporomusa termitida]